jgi:prepilin signal peptidase PulO-like enzyme (type II secretory pathway)
MATESPTATADAVSGDVGAAGNNEQSAATDSPMPRSVPWIEAWVAIVCLAAIMATVGLMARGGHGEGIFLGAFCLGLTALAAGFDAATGRIPNPITYTGVLAGLFINCLGAALQRISPHLAEQWLGSAGPTQSVLGLLLFGGIGLVGMFFAGMGGGDMKLLAAIGAVLGLARAGDVLLCGAAVAVVYSVVNLLIAGKLNATVRTAASHLLILIYLRERPSISAETPSPASRRTIPLAIPLLAGLMLSGVPAIAGAIGWLTHPA